MVLRTNVLKGEIYKLHKYNSACVSPYEVAEVLSLQVQSSLVQAILAIVEVIIYIYIYIYTLLHIDTCFGMWCHSVRGLCDEISKTHSGS